MLLNQKNKKDEQSSTKQPLVDQQPELLIDSVGELLTPLIVDQTTKEAKITPAPKQR